MRGKYQWAVLLTVIVGGAALAHGAIAREDGPSTYTNAQVVSVDVTGRTLVIRNAKGLEEKLQLDDNLAGFGDIKAGDRVILTLRTGPGWARVSSIARSQAVPASKNKNKAASSTSPPGSAVDDSQVRASREAFGAQVASLAAQADRVDRVWNEFRSSCNPAEGDSHDRGWFAIWQGSLRADLSGGFCRDLFNQIIDLGEPVKAGMTVAEDAARRTLSPGDIREIRRQYRMDWDGWGRTPPKRLEQ